jgi:energy-coupling factor transporter ATP-binding protein EcfA2
MTAGNGQVAPAGVSADAASQLRRGAGRTGRAGPGTGPVTGVGGRGSAVPAVRVEGVVKRFGATVALDGAGLEVPAGMVFGLLGPNGAGKTTLVRILATLLAPDGGRAEVFGRDVAAEPAAVRELIGLTGQSRRSTRSCSPARCSCRLHLPALAAGVRDNQPRHRHRRRRPLARPVRHPGRTRRGRGLDRRPAGRLHPPIRMALPADQLSPDPPPENPGPRRSQVSVIVRLPLIKSPLDGRAKVNAGGSREFCPLWDEPCRRAGQSRVRVNCPGRPEVVTSCHPAGQFGRPSGHRVAGGLRRRRRWVVRCGPGTRRRRVRCSLRSSTSRRPGSGASRFPP